MIVVAAGKEGAIHFKKYSFLQHTGFKTATSYEILNLLCAPYRNRYSFLLNPAPADTHFNIVHPGYFIISSFK